MKFELMQDFRNIINQTMINTWNTTIGRPHEPDYVANLVLYGVPEFHSVISAYTNVWRNVSTVGVFCHQSPLVKYSGAENGCELGDILFCHFHKNIQGDTFRNALLFQSKAQPTNDLQIPYNDTQLKLYREWPQFKYTRPTNLIGQSRHLIPSLPHAGAQYMLIDNNPLTVSSFHPFFEFPIGTTTVVPGLIADTPLETELVRFLFFSSGRQFDSYNNRNTDEWTKIVWDLLRVGMERAFNRKRSGYVNAPRISGGATNMDGTMRFVGSTDDVIPAFDSDFMKGLNDFLNSDIKNPKDGKYKPEDGEDGGAPSIIVFVTEESKEKIG